MFELVLRLKTLEVDADLIIHVVHAAGKRMIAQGTDSLSRGEMQWVSMEVFVPLHLLVSALERSTELCSWLTAAAKGLDQIFFEPEDWFTKGQGGAHLSGTLHPLPPMYLLSNLGEHVTKAPQIYTLLLSLVSRLDNGGAT